MKIYGTSKYHNDILDDTYDNTLYAESQDDYIDDKSNNAEKEDPIYSSEHNQTVKLIQHGDIPGLKIFHKFKFFRQGSEAAGSSPWKWPYIDVKYYVNNGSHITNIDFQREVFHVPTDLFYPIVMRPFGTLWLPAPKNSRAYLRAKYNNFTCRSSPWNHKMERRRQIKAINCKKLTKFYPFVWRYRFDGGVLETLKIGHHVLHTVALGEVFQRRYGPFNKQHIANVCRNDLAPLTFKA